MDDVTLPEAVRVALISLTVVVMVLIFRRMWKLWPVMSLAEKFLFWGMQFLLASMAGRSVVAIQQGADFVWPLWLYMAGTICFIVYLTEPETRYRLRYRALKKRSRKA